MSASTTNGDEVHLGAAAHALALRSSPCILGDLWLLVLLLWWLKMQGTSRGAAVEQAGIDQHVQCIPAATRAGRGVLLYVRAAPKGPGYASAMQPRARAKRSPLA